MSCYENDADLLALLRRVSTPAVCNAIERFRARMRNEGYVGSAVPRRIVGPASLVGYAFPLRMKTGAAPVRGTEYADSTDWWDLLASAPKPTVIVIEDVDAQPGVGSVAGEVHGAIFKAFGAAGLITNGAVRDCEALSKMGLHVYAAGVTPSHAYAHIVDVGEPVDIAGLAVRTGDLLHGDQHGFTSIPAEIIAELPGVVEELIARERIIIDLCSRHPVPTTELKLVIAAFEQADATAS